MLRRVSVTQRLVAVALVGFLVAGIAAVIGAVGVDRVERRVDEVGELSDALVAGSRISAELVAVSTAAETADEDDGALLAAAQRLDSVAVEYEAAIGDLLGTEQVGEWTAAIDEVAAAATEPDAASVADALAVAGDVHADTLTELRSRQRAASDAAARTSSRSSWLLVVAIVVGLIVAIVAAVGVARSVTRPLRQLGRALRRFGDGDTTVRSSVAFDEVGTVARSFNQLAESVGLQLRTLTDHATRGTQLRLVSDALDLADRESDAYRITERAFGILAPGTPIEMLVNDPATSTLSTVAENPVAGPPNCPVEQTSDCVAMRRGRTMHWTSPTSIDACPMLRLHDAPCSAVCVPVASNGDQLGVVHLTGEVHDPPPAEVVDRITNFAGQLGVRVSAMRTLETTRMQASTDGLTGLSNRRTLEAHLAEFLRHRTPFVLVLADVDHFKHLNDTYGHEVGDRALQLFSSVLEDNVRGRDVVSRYGGEEFVLVYPEMSVKPSMEVIERIRGALAAAFEGTDIPPFTASFGVTHSGVANTVESIIRIADAGLLMAKELGRNHVVYADQELAAQVFGPEDPAVTGSPPVTADEAT